MDSELDGEGVVRGKRIYGDGGIFPVSRSSWYAGINDGRYPPPVKIGVRSVAWRKSDLRALLEHLDGTPLARQQHDKPRA